MEGGSLVVRLDGARGEPNGELGRHRVDLAVVVSRHRDVRDTGIGLEPGESDTRSIPRGAAADVEPRIPEVAAVQAAKRAPAPEIGSDRSARVARAQARRVAKRDGLSVRPNPLDCVSGRTSPPEGAAQTACRQGESFKVSCRNPANLRQHGRARDAFKCYGGSNRLRAVEQGRRCGSPSVAGSAQDDQSGREDSGKARSARAAPPRVTDGEGDPLTFSCSTQCAGRRCSSSLRDTSASRCWFRTPRPSLR
jgi:hypothetical protein